MAGQGGPGVDLAGLVVPLAGGLVATGDRWEPYRLVYGDGLAVDCVGAFFGHLQAAGRAELTVRSYGMDLLRWFRFLWAAGVAWERATRSDARDFCRWLQLAGKPVRPHWRERGRPSAGWRDRMVEPESATLGRADLDQPDEGSHWPDQRRAWLAANRGLRLARRWIHRPLQPRPMAR